MVLAAVSVQVGAYDVNASEEGRAMLYITRIPRTVSLLLNAQGVVTIIIELAGGGVFLFMLLHSGKE